MSGWVLSVWVIPRHPEIMLHFIDIKTLIEYQHIGIGGGKPHCPSEKILIILGKRKELKKERLREVTFPSHKPHRDSVWMKK